MTTLGHKTKYKNIKNDSGISIINLKKREVIKLMTKTIKYKKHINNIQFWEKRWEEREKRVRFYDSGS